MSRSSPPEPAPSWVYTLCSLSPQLLRILLPPLSLGVPIVQTPDFVLGLCFPLNGPWPGDFHLSAFWGQYSVRVPGTSSPMTPATYTPSSLQSPQASDATVHLSPSFLVPCREGHVMRLILQGELVPSLVLLLQYSTQLSPVTICSRSVSFSCCVSSSWDSASIGMNCMVRVSRKLVCPGEGLKQHDQPAQILPSCSAAVGQAPPFGVPLFLFAMPFTLCTITVAISGHRMTL